MFKDPAILSTLITTVGTVLVAIISSVVTLFLKRWFDKQDRKKVHDVAKQVISDTRLERVLQEIKELTDAPRVCVWAYSNGGYFYTGQAMQHLSMIAEAVDSEYVPIKDRNQRVPIHMFNRSLSKLMTSPTGHFHEYNELQYNDAMSKINQEYDTVSISMFRILNKEGKDIGILTLGFPTHTMLGTAETELIKGMLPTIKHEIEDR